MFLLPKNIFQSEIILKKALQLASCFTFTKWNSINLDKSTKFDHEITSPEFATDNIKLQRGFTMIELLVALVTMSLMFAIGFANFRDFQTRQILRGARENIKGDLRFAQELALAGRKPSGCDVLESYTFEYVSSTSYRINANCANGDYQVGTDYDFSDKYPNVTFQSPFVDVVFRILGRGVVSNSTLTLVLGTEMLLIEVKRGGDIR